LAFIGKSVRGRFSVSFSFTGLDICRTIPSFGGGSGQCNPSGYVVQVGYF
jgi:hypothetical protein